MDSNEGPDERRGPGTHTSSDGIDCFGATEIDRQVVCVRDVARLEITRLSKRHDSALTKASGCTKSQTACCSPRHPEGKDPPGRYQLLHRNYLGYDFVVSDKFSCVTPCLSLIHSELKYLVTSATVLVTSPPPASL